MVKKTQSWLGRRKRKVKLSMPIKPPCPIGVFAVTASHIRTWSVTAAINWQQELILQPCAPLQCSADSKRSQHHYKRSWVDPLTQWQPGESQWRSLKLKHVDVYYPMWRNAKQNAGKADCCGLSSPFVQVKHSMYCKWGTEHNTPKNYRFWYYSVSLWVNAYEL